MQKPEHGLETRLIHAGEPLPRIEGAVSMPIFQSSTYAYGGEGSYHEIRYIRLNNTPNHHALHAKLAAIENAEAALVMASGMAAVATTLLTVVGAGERLMAQDCLYGGTHDLLRVEFPRLRIATDFIDCSNPAGWREQLTPQTKAIYVETISNPLMQVGDLRAVAEFAREHGLVSIIDNTFASPVNFRPAEIGFDLSLHSGTKYLNGHSDIVAGAVIGRADLVSRINLTLGHLGAALDPHACFLLHRGLKTLAVRTRFQNDSALKIAEFLEAQPEVSHVNYPGLASSPSYRRATELFEGSGGCLSFELKGGLEAADSFIRKLTIPICAPSLGGVESLVTRPATTSHAGMAREERERAGVHDGLIRLSIGLEATADLIEDCRQALKPGE
ncbi:MAG TPA: aminotransferase class I/II-fold pyridoxal phosphate-dependent enzyme [Candidatus Binataceae bacterium]|nr:aminotransferase class I/II-fold pyridoxal phosphate-dependent enzyme [Candidatus Binataceae bacterium]